MSVPIQQLLKEQKHSFGPDDIKVLSAAFEEALRQLGLADRTDPATQLVALSASSSLRSRASVTRTDCARVL